MVVDVHVVPKISFTLDFFPDPTANFCSTPGSHVQGLPMLLVDTGSTSQRGELHQDLVRGRQVEGHPNLTRSRYSGIQLPLISSNITAFTIFRTLW